MAQRILVHQEDTISKQIQLPICFCEESSRKGCAIIIIFREKRWTAYKSMYGE